MNNEVQEHLTFLVQNITSPPEHLLMLRATLEASLLKLGHDEGSVNLVLDSFYNAQRTTH